MKYFTVEQFGAVGNGEQDDTEAINVALQTIAELGGGIVYFTNKRYKTTNSIIIPQGVTICGLSAGAIPIKEHT